MAHLSFFILAFHILFFWRHYTTNCLATGETLSTFFPSLVHIGRCIRQGKWWNMDKCYWLNFHAHPVLSSYYPPHIIASLIVSFFDINTQFNVFKYVTLLHHLFMNIGYYLLFSLFMDPITALFWSITVSYCAFFLKPQSCIIYTLSWIPWFFYGIKTSLIIASIACGMSLLGGYYPLSIYLLPIGFLFSPMAIVPLAIGSMIALPQLIPFFRYLPKTNKVKEEKSPSVGPWEYNYYFGLSPILLILLTFKLYYIELLLIIPLSILIRRYIPRVYSRTWCILLVIMPLVVKIHVPIALVILQCFDLWLFNRSVIPYEGYQELPRKPSWTFNTKLTRFLSGKQNRVSGLPWPLFTGIINNIKTLGYCGSMQNKMMERLRGNNGQHEWDGSYEDPRLDSYRVGWAFTSQKINWKSTGIKNLYSNPRLSS
jgi:hypothetical protein